MPLVDVVAYYSGVVASIFLLGEILVALKTQKYWPLSADDYVVCSLLIIAGFNLEQTFAILLLVFSWAFLFGNLYAMLFYRLSPEGKKERILLLAMMLLLTFIGVVLSFSHLYLTLI